MKLFLIKLYVRISIFKFIEKCGRNEIKVARSVKVYCARLSKTKFDIDFLLKCKIILILTFALTKATVKVSYQLRNKLS